MSTVGSVICSTCQICYPKTRFTVSRMNKDGVTGICKKCVRAMSVHDTHTGCAVLDRRLSRNMAVNTKRHDLLMARVHDFEKRHKVLLAPAVLNKRVSRHATASMKRHDKLVGQAEDFKKRQNMLVKQAQDFEKRQDILMVQIRDLTKQIQKLQQPQLHNQLSTSCLPVGLQGGTHEIHL